MWVYHDLYFAARIRNTGLKDHNIRKLKKAIVVLEDWKKFEQDVKIFSTFCVLHHIKSV